MVARKIARWVVYVALPWFVETSVFAFLIGPLCWIEYWYSMRERV